MTNSRPAEIAAVWNAAVDAGEAPQSAVREAFSEVTQRTIQRWVREAGEAGLLKSWHRAWRNGSRIEAVASDLGVERHELAQAVLRHASDGRLHVHEYDAAPASVPDNLAVVFGGMIRSARTERHWTQEKLALKVGEALGRNVSTLTVSRTEAGTRPAPLGEVAAFAVVLNLSVDKMIQVQVGVSGEDQ